MKQEDHKAVDLKKIEHSNRVLLALRQIGKLLITEGNTARLIQQACDILVNSRGYFNAWICLTDESYSVLETAHSGFNQKFNGMQDQLKAGKFPHCIRQLMQHDHVFSASNPLEECSGCDLSKNYARRGAFASRLEYESQVYGFMVLSTPLDIFMDQDEISIVEDIANDIAFGLYRLELEEEKRVAEKARQDSALRFQTLIENSLNCIVILQEDRLVYANTGHRSIHQSLDRVFDPKGFDAVYDEDRDAVASAYRDLVSKKTRHMVMDFRYYPPGKTKTLSHVRWALLSACIIDYMDVESVLINIMDITNSKEVENFLQIQDKMTSLGRVTAGIAHEIRNPLSGINIYLKALRKLTHDVDDAGKVISIIDKVEKASNKIESIVRRVMDFSRPGKPHFVMTNLNKYIDDVAQLTAVTLRKNGIRFIQDLDENLPECWAEPHLIEQVILNIITNAVEAMREYPGDKEIVLKTFKRKQAITISIKDTGPGIPLSIQSKVFDPFYTTKSNSSGIGLSICHRIITDHGGALRFKSMENAGVEFLIELPLKKGGQV
ncbi:MAG: GHKL domain-containing protein [Desulfobacteraceae bacterium]|nr:MAG: GHKL domain-containing protein [Desulfobacteraceae bacterium]